MLKIVIFMAICFQSSASADLVITPIAGPPTNLTDTIFWNGEDYSMYYVDYLTNGTESSIFRYDYIKKTLHSAYINGRNETTYLIPVKQCGRYSETILYKKLFMAGSMHDNLLIEWDGYKPVANVIRTVFSVETNSPSSKMDLSKQNWRGEFFGGTTTDQYCTGPSNSSLYTYSNERGARKIYSGFQSTAGITFYGDKIYLADVCLQTITELKKDFFGNYVSRIVFDFKTQDNTTRPSGLETDSVGNLYVVGYTNGKVWRINPITLTGEVIATFDYFLTGVAFGGPNRDILFVLTSSALLQAWPLKVLVYKPAPPLFMIEGLGAKGVASEKLQC